MTMPIADVFDAEARAAGKHIHLCYVPVNSPRGQEILAAQNQQEES